MRPQRTKFSRHGDLSSGDEYTPSVVGIASYDLDCLGFESPWWQEIFTEPTSLLLIGNLASFPGLKRPGRHVKHPLPSNAEVKDNCSYTSTPSIRLHDVDSAMFIMFIFN